MKKGSILIFLLFVSLTDLFAANFFAVTNGDWGDANTWASSPGGTPGAGVPGSGDIAITSGFQIGLNPIYGDVTVDRLTVSNSVANSIFYNDPFFFFTPVSLTINLSLSSTGTPTAQIIENSSFLNVVIRGTGSAVINNWSSTSPFNNITFSSGGNTTINSNLAVNGGDLTVNNNTSLTLGSSRTFSNPNGNSNLIIESGATLVVNGAINGDGSNTSRFGTVTVNGTLNSGSSGYLNSENIILGSGSIFNISFNGADQTQGWWYQNVAPTGIFNISASSTINYRASADQNVGALTYGNLGLFSPTSSSVKTLQGGNTLNVEGDFIINSANVTFNSTVNSQPITLSSDLVNNGNWSPSQLVIFNGSTLQSINGNNTVVYNGGARISNTEEVILSNIGMDINGELDVDPGCTLNPFDQDINISGNMRIDGTLLAGSDRGFIFDGITNYFGTGFRNFNDFTITSSATVNAPSGVLTINGDFVNDGSFDNGGGTFEFSGTEVKEINGSVTSSFNNINLTGGTLRITGNADLENVMTLSASTTLDADGISDTGVFTLKSDGTTDGAIATIPTSAVISGDFTVERYIDKVDPSLNRGYHIFGVPLNGVTVADIQDELPINGTFTGASNYIGPGGTNPSNPNNPSLYRYVESSGGAISARYVAFPPANSSETFVNGEGYSLFTFTGLAPVTVNGRGTLHRNNFSKSLSFTGTGTDAGWHTVANPYPAPTDWQLWGKVNVEGNTAYIFDPTNGNYIAYDGTAQQLIPQGQGFFVRVTAAGSVSATESTKVTGSTPDYFRGANLRERFEIVLKRDSSEDIAIVSLQEGATDAYEGEFDATRLLNVNETLSTKSSDGKNLKVNRLAKSGVQACSKSIYLNLEQMSATEEYRIEFRDVSHLTQYSLELIDHYLDETHQIADNSEIVFEVNNDAGSKGDTRFELIFNANPPAKRIVDATEICSDNNAVVEIPNTEKKTNYFIFKADSVVASILGTGASELITIPKESLIEGLNEYELKASALCDTVAIGEVNVRVKPSLDLTSEVSGSAVCINSESASFEVATQDNVDYALILKSDTLIQFSGNGLSYKGILATSKLQEGLNEIKVNVSLEGCQNGILDNTIQIEIDDVSIDKNIAYSGETVCYSQPATVTIDSQEDILYEVFKETKRVGHIIGTGDVIAIPVAQEYLSVGNNELLLRAEYASCQKYDFPEAINILMEKALPNLLNYKNTNVCKGNDGDFIIENAVAGLTYEILKDSVVLSSKVAINSGLLTLTISKDYLDQDINRFEVYVKSQNCRVKSINNLELTVLEQFSLTPIENVALCSGETKRINAEADFDVEKFFLYEDGQLVAENSTGLFDINPQESTSYEIIANSISGCQSNKIAFEALVDELEDPVLNANGNVIEITNVGEASIKWFKNDKLLEGEDASILIVKETGNYYAELNLGSCNVLSETVEIDATVLRNNTKLKNSFSIHPNPVKDKLTVDFTYQNIDEIRLTIYALSGELINSYKFRESGKTINLENYEKGIYIFEFETNDGSFAERIVKD